MTCVERDMHMKPTWEDMRDKGIRENGTVREIEIVAMLINTKEPNIKINRAEGLLCDMCGKLDVY